MSQGNFIRLNRKFFESHHWAVPRTFSNAEAFLDLIQMARWQTSDGIKTLSSGKTITIKRGEIHASLRFLSSRWVWSIDRVRRFLVKANNCNEIKQRTQHQETLLLLVNYNTYNPPPKQTSTPTSTPTSTNIKNKRIQEVEDVEEGARTLNELSAIQQQQQQRIPTFDSVSIPVSEIRYPPEILEMFEMFKNYWNEMAGTLQDPGHVVRIPEYTDSAKSKIILDFIATHTTEELEMFLKNIYSSKWMRKQAETEGRRWDVFKAIDHGERVIAGEYLKIRDTGNRK